MLCKILRHVRYSILIMERLIELALPTFAFIEGSDHEKKGNILRGRNVIFHTRSASVLEVFEREKCFLNEDIIKYSFDNINIYGLVEHFVIALHYSATIEKTDREFIINEVLKPAAIWYCEYCDWEDEKISYE